jgi:hypothetical protein
VTEREAPPRVVLRPGLRLRLWVALFKAADGWYAKGQLVRATIARAGRRLRG